MDWLGRRRIYPPCQCCGWQHKRQFGPLVDEYSWLSISEAASVSRWLVQRCWEPVMQSFSTGTVSGFTTTLTSSLQRVGSFMLVHIDSWTLWSMWPAAQSSILFRSFSSTEHLFPSFKQHVMHQLLPLPAPKRQKRSLGQTGVLQILYYTSCRSSPYLSLMMYLIFTWIFAPKASGWALLAATAASDWRERYFALASFVTGCYIGFQFILVFL